MEGQRAEEASLSLSLLLSWLCVQIGAEGGEELASPLFFPSWAATVGRSRVGRRKMVVARRSALDSLSCPSIAVRST